MKAKDKFFLYVGISIVSALLMVGVIGGLYWLICQLGVMVLRWVAVGLVLALPLAVVITYRLATHAASEHLAGFNRGLDGAERTIQSVGRGLSATASMARATRNLPQAQQSNDDLLPRPGTMRILDAGKSDNSIIDL